MPDHSMSSPSCRPDYQHENRVPEPERSFGGEAARAPAGASRSTRAVCGGRCGPGPHAAWL
jgi:hypothetical protein